MIGLIDRETRQDRDRDRVRHVATESPGDAGHGDCSGREGVVPDDFIVVAYHEGTSRSAGLIGARTTPQPVIERRLATMKLINLVMIRQRRRRQQRPTHSQGAGVWRDFRKRLFGFGGASSRATNAR